MVVSAACPPPVHVFAPTNAMLIASKKRTSPSPTPERTSKRMRTQTRTLSRSKTEPLGSCKGMGSDNQTLIRTKPFTERVPEATNRIARHSIPELSSFRPEFADPQGQPRPSTPMRASARPSFSRHESASPAPAETPPWARSMHLVDTNEHQSIYKNVHGDEWMDSPLCLYCFRQKGCFNRVKTHGYQVCGREEALQSHYWDPNVDSWMDY